MSLIYKTKTFANVFDTEATFKTSFKATVFNGALEDDKLSILYYLLYAKYGNNPIANLDENQFKYKVYSIIFSYGPAWAKRIDIQDKLRNLKEEELITGARQINNHAFNPAGEPSTDQLDALPTINDQTSTNYRKSKMEAYGALWDLISTDVTTEFINKFSICFKTVVAPEEPLIYVTDIES